MWRRDTHAQQMTGDWLRVLHTLLERPDVDERSIGWYGVSMGTAYGVPLLAVEPRIRAAVVGMWALDFDNSAFLGPLAEKIACPLLFQQKWDDQLFSRDGQVALFTRLGSERKWLKVYPGLHTLEPEVVDDAEAFLAGQLREPAG